MMVLFMATIYLIDTCAGTLLVYYSMEKRRFLIIQFRFESGLFYRHPLMAEYEFYWRVEPSVEFFCDLDYDPFLYMKENDKKYGKLNSLFERIISNKSK
jgi:hypothetical protein